MPAVQLIIRLLTVIQHCRNVYVKYDKRKNQVAVVLWHNFLEQDKNLRYLCLIVVPRNKRIV